ncbi:Sulfite reductase [NADPH] hemoprotein beta-component [Minicystis rosea]|nr:Sulfite reductase [NADPH] hemoprotein beta-component [Minicystis rosea]
MQRLHAAIDEHAANIDRFKRGEITPDQFRPLRLAMGLYAQLAHVKHMQRIKVPGGRITAEQLEVMADVTERWGRGLAHVTTRQDVQLHHFELEDSVAAQRELARVGVNCVGACADCVRNVTASPFAGVLADEIFDVTPYAHAITEHFAFHEHNRRLPRKFKVGFSGSAADHAQVMINDLGLFAAVRGDERGFRVYVAGGLGSTPEVAHLWIDFLPERELLVAAEAAVSIFFRDGERKNRKKNRLKFLLRKLGEAEFFRRLDEERARLQADRGDRLAAELERLKGGLVEAPPPPLEEGAALGDAAFARWRRTNTIKQKQPGYCVAIVKLPLGDMTVPQMRALAAISREIGNGEVRATNTQNIILRWVPEARLPRLHRALGLIGLAEPDAEHITDVVSCPGGDYCTLAITRSMKLGADIREHLAPSATRTEADDVVKALGVFSIKVSGCFNSCGQHHVADIGMTGLMVKGTDGVERPHYSLRVGGGCGPDARIGERLDGRIPEEETPKVVAAIARHYLAERGEGETFKEFVARVGAMEITRIGFQASAHAI